jgi:hypothetical protein
MFKTFIAGILLGIAGAAAALYYVPVVNQSREHSLIVVHPNQGNTETFHVNVPMDRILVGVPGQQEPLPVGLQWPEDVRFAGTRAELFKIRNGKDAVVGVASRLTASDDVSGDIVEWVFHFPSRGSAYVAMEAAPREEGYRIGELTTGTREFAPLTGIVTERWITDTSGIEDAPAGRIEIITAFEAKELEGEE